MRVVVQRVREAKVTVAGTVVGSIGIGLLVLVGVGRHDDLGDAGWMAAKVAGLRIFPDDAGRMNRDVRSVNGSVLSVSQFTLYGDATRGRRPSFTEAAEPGDAERVWEAFNTALTAHGIVVKTGRFRADMDVMLVNWGPVTLWLESPRPSG
jgi:D-tyrosyl-tRNA(Tyr) deacylase